MPRWRHHSLVIALLLSAITLLPRPALASEGFQPISPEELQMKSEPQAPGAPAIILFRQVDRDDLTYHEVNYYRIKIFTEEGRKQADVEIPYFKSVGSVYNIKARTIRPDGTVANFDGKVYEKTEVKSSSVKFLAKSFTLPDVQVGSIIEYYYSRDWHQYWIYDSHWILSEELFTKHAKFSLKPYLKGRFSVRWSWQGLPPGTPEPRQEPNQVVRLEVNNIPAFQTEQFMPPENELKSRVDFVYSEDYVELDPDKFWKKEGKKLNGRAEGFVGNHKAMEQAVAQIVAPNDPPELKLQKIYARVQQFRNTSYEARKTEQEEKRENPKEINNVEELWKQGYGDGYHLTWLYLALVRAAGFEAYPVQVSARSEYFFNPQRENPNELNSNVVLVKLNGKDIYCDPGTAFAPFGLLPWAETGVQGLRLDKDGGTWIKTAIPESSESRIERKAALKLTEEGALEGKLTITYSGLEALSRRLEERNEDDTSRNKFLEDQVRECIPVGIDLELTNKPDWASSAPTLVAEFDLKVPGWASAAGRRATIAVGLFGGTEKHMFEHASRVYPLYMRFPFQKLDDVTIALPLGWQVSSLPKGENDDGHIVVYSIKSENNKGTLHVVRSLNVDFLMIDTKYYPALRSFFQLVKAGDEQQIVLQPGAAASSN
jgi:hypothetical protein